MDATSLPSVRSGQRAEASLTELRERIALAVPDDGMVEPMDGLQLRRASSLTEPVHSVSFPAVCIVAEGGKAVWLGDACYRYDPAHYLITTAEIPIMSRITRASPERPYLRLLLELDPALVGSVMVEVGHLAPRHRSDVAAVNTSPVDDDLLDAAVRLLRLLDSSVDVRILGPLIKREIVYRLVMGHQGGRLRHVATAGGYTQRIAEAMVRLRNDFDRPLRIEEMARDLGMSVSRFHHHFKAVTTMSPLEYQKQLRLQEARRLMLGEDVDAASAGFRVGYNDASHFSREYKRLFGEPPMRDVERLRGTVLESASL